MAESSEMSEKMKNSILNEIASEMAEKGAKSLSRPINKCCIVMFGLSGSGKSSTINHMFNIKIKGEVAETSSSASQTRCTTEYKLESEDKKFCVAFIDTPGFGDTRGQQQDACNLNTICKFFQLNDYNQVKPNLIFITISAADNRYEGECSHIVQALKCLKTVDIVDQKHPNVVLVITHCCSLCPHYLVKKNLWIEKIKTLKSKLSDLVYEHVGVNAPVVIIENKYEDQGLKRRRWKDGKESEFTTLPDGEEQPLNLYKACEDVFYKSKDYNGDKHFTKCFVKGDKMRSVKGLEVKEKIAEGNNLDSTEMTLFDIIRDKASGGIQDETKEKTLKFLRVEDLTDEAKSEVKEIEEIIRKTENQKSVTSSLIEFELTNDLSDTGRKYLTEVMSVEDKETTVHNIDKLQNGFRLDEDELSESKIYEMKTMISRYGFSLPNIYKVEKITKPVAQISTFNIPAGQKSFMRVSEGSVIRSREFPEFTGTSTVTEVTVFELSFDFDAEIEWTKELKEEIEKLPPYDSSSKEVYQNFFKKFGTSIISKAFVGGYRGVTESGGISCEGGDPSLVDQDEFVENFENWRLSILSHPVLLLNELHLEPISAVVKMVKSELEQDVQNALTDFKEKKQITTNLIPNENSSQNVIIGDGIPMTKEEANSSQNMNTEDFIPMNRREAARMLSLFERFKVPIILGSSLTLRIVFGVICGPIGAGIGAGLFAAVGGAIIGVRYLLNR